MSGLYSALSRIRAAGFRNRFNCATRASSGFLKVLKSIVLVLMGFVRRYFSIKQSICAHGGARDFFDAQNGRFCLVSSIGQLSNRRFCATPRDTNQPFLGPRQFIECGQNRPICAMTSYSRCGLLILRTKRPICVIAVKVVYLKQSRLYISHSVSQRCLTLFSQNRPICA